MAGFEPVIKSKVKSITTEPTRHIAASYNLV